MKGHLLEYIYIRWDKPSMCQTIHISVVTLFHCVDLVQRSSIVLMNKERPKWVQREVAYLP